jgi:SAM-dependent methyltransferase
MAQGVGYGENAELYDRVRPHYPDALIDEVVALVGGAGRAVDAATGTAKAAVALAARGLTGVAVDLDPLMAAVAERNLARSPGWRVAVAAFEEWGPEPGEAPFDLVVSAHAWHWFRPLAAFTKANELLRPGGWLALWWNGPEDFDSPARRAITSAYATHAPEIVHRGIAGYPRPDGLRAPAGTGFGVPLLSEHRWTAAYTAQHWVDLARTAADHRELPAARREAVLAASARIIEEHGGIYEHPYVCGLWAARRVR